MTEPSVPSSPPPPAAAGEHAAAKDAGAKYVANVTGSSGFIVGDYGTIHLPPRGPVEWPMQLGVPPPAAEAFQPRPELAGRLAPLGGEGSGPVVVTQVVAGAGGVGKTQLAAAAFRTAWAGGAGGVDLAVWLTASSRAGVVASYADAYLQVSPAAVDLRQDAQRRAEAFLAWLASTNRSWLIVLDDVAAPADLRGLWPPADRADRRVIVTTRRRDLALAGARRVEVGVFTPTESVAYLKAKLAPSTRQGLLEEAEQLASDLGHLPVALAQAAAAILIDDTSCAHYRALFADRTRQLADLLPADVLADDYAHTTATTWTLAADRADELHPAGLARPALLLAAVLDPNGAPTQLWRTTPARTYLTTHRTDQSTAEVSPDDAHRALRNLHRLSLISHIADTDTGQDVRTHALTQRAVIDTLTASLLDDTVRAAADALRDAWPKVANNPPYAATLRTNATHLADQGPDTLWQPHAHQVLFRTGQSLVEVALARQAVSYFTHLARESEQRLGPDHLDTFAARANLAGSRGANSDPFGAVTEFERLLADQLRVLGPDHFSIDATRSSLAVWSGAVGQVREGIADLERVLTNQLRLLGPDHTETLATRRALAFFRGHSGDPPGAVAEYERLLVDMGRVLGPDDPDTLFARDDLAFWRVQDGDAVTALADYEALLADMQRVLGPDHGETIAARGRLADSRARTGDHAGAVADYERLVADQLRVRGADHPLTLAARGGLAHQRGMTGDSSGAVAELNRLLTDQMRVLGSDDALTLATRRALAIWRGNAGDPGGAAAALEQLLTDQERVLGPDHPDTLNTRDHLDHWRKAAL
jgi:hypothetical protein